MLEEKFIYDYEIYYHIRFALKQNNFCARLTIPEVDVSTPYIF